MSFARRAIPSRRVLSSGAFARTIQPTQRTWSLVSRRSYASGSDHGEHKSGSDIPWAIGSAVVTIGGGGYLLSQTPAADDSHGHGDHGEHDEEHGLEEETHDTKEAEKGDDESAEASEEKDESKNDEEDDGESEKKDSKQDDKTEKSESKKDDKPTKKDSSEDKSESESDSGDESKDTPDTSDDESQDEKHGSEEVGGKPYSSLSPDKTQNQGAAGYKQKVGQTEGEGPKAASAAMHRDRDHSDSTLSKKSEGYHDTARIQEPIDPFRKAK